MRITFKQLEIFVEIAKRQHMSHAAEALHLTQSACSMALSTLENQLGQMLFDRHKKKLTLNEYGRYLLPKSINLISQIKEWQELAIYHPAKELKGHLIIGASSTIGNYLLPAIIGEFIQMYPQVKVTLNIANTEHITNQLLRFEIDLGMIEGKCYAPEIVVTPWGKDELIVVASPQYPLNKKYKLSLAELRKRQWILREPGSGTRERFEEALGGKIHPLLELGHSEAIKNAVQKGYGLGCLSKLIVSDALKSGQLVELKTSLSLIRNFYLLLHKDKHTTPLLKAFIAHSKLKLMVLLSKSQERPQR